MNRRFQILAISLSLASLPTEAADKVPITTSSPAALESYLQGRDLAEKLRGQEARAHFEKAIELDLDFAMAYLSGSLTRATAREFFEHLEAAVSKVDKVSDAEKNWILGFQAGVNGETARQREHYEALLAAYPSDERAHNLFGNHWFGQQEWTKAIQSYERATTIDPDYTQSYNQMGYARRFLEDFEGAERAFEKYISLIPDDPNPYDSYAELLMKTGKYEKSIENYKRALQSDPYFVASHIGIATNLNYLGRHKDARKQLKEMQKQARDDGERRGALFAIAISHLDEGSVEHAIASIHQEQMIAEKHDDAGLKAGDLINIGNILLETGKPAEALALFAEALATMRASERSDKVKATALRVFHYNAARAEIARSSFNAAGAHIAALDRESVALENPFLTRQVHELRGTLHLARGEFGDADAQLQGANQQNAYNLYRIALAHKGQEDLATARHWLEKTVNFNALNSLNYAMVRHKAQRTLDEMNLVLLFANTVTYSKQTLPRAYRRT